MRFSTLALLGAFVVGAVAAPAPVGHVLHERRKNVPKAWTKRSKLTPEAKLPMRVGLTQSNLDKGHDLLMEV